MNDRVPSYEELVAENAAFKRREADQDAEITALKRQVSELTARVAPLLALIDAKNRSGKRQASPFSKGTPKSDPKRPGRKPGDDDGKHERRAAPETVDETIPVPLPDQCPHCGGDHLFQDATSEPYQLEIPRTFLVRKFVIARGKCRDCQRRVHGRHPRQTSDAVGAAGVQLGPHLQSAIAILNKESGLPHGKVKRILQLLFRLDLAKSTATRSMLRTARRAAPGLAEIKDSIRGSPSVKCDETGWRLNGRSIWLHVAVGTEAVLYQIGERSREILRRVIGFEYQGALIHDGFVASDAFRKATHQQCLAHLLKRCHELLEVAVGGAVMFPRAVKELLQEGLAQRDLFHAGAQSLADTQSAAVRLTQRLAALVTPVKQHADNERFAKFLENHNDQIFAFLHRPDVISATNNEREFELRFNVIARKLSGGNRSKRGIEAQEILPSIIRTCRKRTIDPFDYLVKLLTNTHFVPLKLAQTVT
jgi:transposase